MALPKAFCVGAQKAGTTTLADIFRRHDEVFVPQCKEIHYFENAVNFRKGPDWYAGWFVDAAEGQVVMDFTPDYLPSEVCPERIAELCGADCKIVIVVRHPVDRAFSQYNFYRRHNVERNPDFEQALADDSVRTFREYEVWHEPKLYIVRSRYFDAIVRFSERFSSENVLVLQFEKLITPDGQSEAVKTVAQFLGVPEPKFVSGQHSNVTLVPPPGLKSWVFRALCAVREPLKRVAPGQSYHRVRKRMLGHVLDRPKKLDPVLRQKLFVRYFREDCEKLRIFGVRYV